MRLTGIVRSPAFCGEHIGGAIPWRSQRDWKTRRGAMDGVGIGCAEWRGTVHMMGSRGER